MDVFLHPGPAGEGFQATAQQREFGQAGLAAPSRHKSVVSAANSHQIHQQLAGESDLGLRESSAELVLCVGVRGWLSGGAACRSVGPKMISSSTAVGALPFSQIPFRIR